MPLIALCDANSFYCSCEQVFDPSLQGKALGVLSNNDGCVVARTPEIKALGVKMGAPAFQLRDMVEQGQVILKSSNYTLYGDMSARFMSVLEQFSPSVQVYSVDEAFLDLEGFPEGKLFDIGVDIKNRVYQWTGLPIGVGISTTKTLAKLANYAAKKYTMTGGVVDLTSPIRQKKLMAITPVEEVWGVGRQLKKRLNAQGIHMISDLIACDRSWIKRNYSVVLERTLCELQGESCIPWEEETTGNKHQIICSRSFGNRVTTKEELHSALASFISRACEKLRRQNKFAREGSIFVRTDPFKDQLPQYGNSVRISLPTPSNSTQAWLAGLPAALNAAFRTGFEYKKAGFVLQGLCDATGFQGDLLSNQNLPEISPLMNVMDSINQRFGRDCLHPASTGQGSQQWHLRRENLSPSYTTRWADILKVKS